jgi:hypothetical protein
MPCSDAWNLHMMVLIGAACAHLECHVTSCFAHRVVDTGSPDIPPPHIMDVRRSLFAPTAVGFVEDGRLGLAQRREVREMASGGRSRGCCPDVDGLMDAWNFPEA